MRPNDQNKEFLALDQVEVGTSARLSTISPQLSDKLATRLMALGFVPGTEVKVMRRAPLGDPIEFEVRGGRISLRRSEARHLFTTG